MHARARSAGEIPGENKLRSPALRGDVESLRRPITRTGLAMGCGALIALATPCALDAQEARSQDSLVETTEKRFGAGLMIGEPTGVSLKYFLSKRSALDGVVGLSLDQGSDFSIHADYLYHIHDVIAIEEGRFSVYFGGGPRFVARDGRDDLFGLRTVGGLAYAFEDIPVDVFIEGGPVFDVTPDVEVRYTFGAGARFWF